MLPWPAAVASPTRSTSIASGTVAVRLPLLRRESRGYDLYKPTFFPIMHGSHLYDIRTEEKTAPEDTEVRVQCPESPKLFGVIRGQWWLLSVRGTDRRSQVKETNKNWVQTPVE
jgi:hypothetical protein